jgi:hypothetical protein
MMKVVTLVKKMLTTKAVLLIALACATLSVISPTDIFALNDANSSSMSSIIDVIKGSADKMKDGSQVDDTKTFPDVAKNIINVLLFAVSLLSIAFIIYGGIKYNISAGDAAKITTAKNTIMYAIIGLIVSLVAYAIIFFVVDRIT